MKPATISHIKQELKNRPPDELLEICLRLARFKKENKELLTYLLFGADDEQGYIESVKVEIDEQFQEINRSNIYFVKKSIRKILKNTNKYIRYSGNKQTEVELLMHFCEKMKNMGIPKNESVALQNIYSRQVQKIKKTISTLHEDLQFDYAADLKAIARI